MTPKHKALETKKNSNTHNSDGHVWGSPEAIRSFSEKYGTRKHKKEQSGFNRGMREINRLKKAGK